METRTCGRCKGIGATVISAFTSVEGTHYPERRYPCRMCNRTGKVGKPDYEGIVKAIRGRKGLRSKRPDDPRAYYVWRMARFHGGADVTMPMMASLGIEGDPWRAELDALADKMAKIVFGTDLAAAYRWSGLLGRELPHRASLPASAYSGGPVADADKPEEEAAELI